MDNEANTVFEGLGADTSKLHCVERSKEARFNKRIKKGGRTKLRILNFFCLYVIRFIFLPELYSERINQTQRPHIWYVGIIGCDVTEEKEFEVEIIFQVFNNQLSLSFLFLFLSSLTLYNNTFNQTTIESKFISFFI